MRRNIGELLLVDIAAIIWMYHHYKMMVYPTAKNWYTTRMGWFEMLSNETIALNIPPRRSQSAGDVNFRGVGA